MMRKDCLAHLAELHNDELVICNLGRTSGEWWDTKRSADEDTFYMRSSMGLVSSMALGLALALPHRGIWAFDGDGSLAMHLGSLLTLGNVRPDNLLHIVWFNRQYEVTANQPLGASEEVDFAGMAAAAGIENTAAFSTLEDFKEGMKPLVDRRGYRFVVAEVEPSPPIRDESPKYPVDMAYRFGRFIEDSESITIFEDVNKDAT